jgi:glycosyltransferase involved in cell wall biosynthesis
MIEFVVPDLGGRPTGGTRYNARLIQELGRSGVALGVCTADDVRDAELIWIDSLYLERVPEIRRARRAARIGIVLHYLPSLVEHGAERLELAEPERAALDAADLLLVPSEFMARTAVRAGFADRAVFVVEPGTDVALSARAPSVEHGVRALFVGHLVPNKRLEPLLLALAVARLPEGRFSLRIAGDLAADAAYASRCRAVAADSPLLARSVTFLGNLEPKAVEAELAAANLFVSASRMESYGMALRDARAAGVPIVACPGGHVAAHVAPASGGELVIDEAALADACARLASDLGEHRRRVECARANVPPARPWSDAAADLVAALSRAGISVDRTNEGTIAQTRS